MGFFSDILKEITRPFEQAGSEIKRTYERLEDEGKRWDKWLGQQSGIYPPDMPEMPSMPIEPVSGTTMPIKTIAGEVTKRPKKGTGKSFRETILTGDLVPTSTGKKTLLG